MKIPLEITGYSSSNGRHPRVGDQIDFGEKIL